MAVRTTDTLVKAVLLADYDTRRSPNLAPFIAAASAIVNDIANYAANLIPVFDIDSDRLTQIETWLAAHAYQQSDKGYSSRSTSGGSGSFHGQWVKGLENTNYGQMALMLDSTGYLAKLTTNSQTSQASGMWLGKPESRQIPHNQRN